MGAETLGVPGKHKNPAASLSLGRNPAARGQRAKMEFSKAWKETDKKYVSHAGDLLRLSNLAPEPALLLALIISVHLHSIFQKYHLV